MTTLRDVTRSMIVEVLEKLEWEREESGQPDEKKVAEIIESVIDDYTE